MLWDFLNTSSIPLQGFLVTTFGCGKERKYKKMITKANISVSRELDLVKFIQRQRLITFTMLAAFNTRQKFIADKMATKLIRESSDLTNDSQDDFELDLNNLRDIEKHSQKIFHSNDKVDLRLVKVYRAKRWRDDFKYN